MKKTLFLATAAILVATASPAMAANLVTNGSFETGNFSGWTKFGESGGFGVQGALGPFNPTDGVYHARVDPINALGGIEQSIATAPGAQYSISFTLANTQVGSNSFDVSFGSETLYALANSPVFGPQQFIFSAFANSASTPLRFSFLNQQGFHLLDSVSVTRIGAGAVPEPATWAMMITGFGLVGAGMRRRQQTMRVTYA